MQHITFLCVNCGSNLPVQTPPSGSFTLYVYIIFMYVRHNAILFRFQPLNSTIYYKIKAKSRGESRTNKTFSNTCYSFAQNWILLCTTIYRSWFGAYYGAMIDNNASRHTAHRAAPSHVRRNSFSRIFCCLSIVCYNQSKHKSQIWTRFLRFEVDVCWNWSALRPLIWFFSFTLFFPPNSVQ